MRDTQDFTPALGYRALTPLYDLAIALLTRERTWRRALLAELDPKPGERILDIGCGTGNFALLIKKAEPAAAVVGLDPDGQVLARARRKACRAGAEITFMEGFCDAGVLRRIGLVDKVVSSLVLHQVPLAEKARILATARELLVPGGSIHIADYGLQRSRLMRWLFRIVQRLDGVDNTEPNARGILPELLRRAGFAGIDERRVIPTATGSISLLGAYAPVSKGT